MSILSRIKCILGKHDPDRHKVHHDGRTYYGRCRHCGIEIERRDHRDWIIRQDRGSNLS